MMITNTKTTTVDTTSPVADEAEKHGLRLAPLMLLLAAPFLGQADATIANVATPSIGTVLHASPAALQLVIGGYILAFSVLLITCARLGQTHGYKLMYLIGIATFGATSLVAGLSPNVVLLILMRVLQGAGAAMMFPQALTGIQLNFRGEPRTRAIALFSIALSAGAVLGQILGGVLVSADIAGASWRPIFLVNVPVCLGVLLAAARLLPTDGRRRGARIDLPGVAMLSLSMLLLILPLTLGPGEAWPAWSWLALMAAIPSFTIFVITQLRTDDRDPLLNVAVIARPTISLGLLAQLISTCTYYALLFTFAQYYQRGLGHTPLASGLMLLPWVIAFGVAGQITRRLASRHTRLLPVVGFVALAAAYIGIGAGLVGHAAFEWG